MVSTKTGPVPKHKGYHLSDEWSAKQHINSDSITRDAAQPTEVFI